MRVLRWPGDDLYAPSCATVGNFDGVHLGHRVLVYETVELGRRYDLKSTVITFSTHTAGKRVITTLPEKLELLEELGPERAIVLDFEKVSGWEPEEFLEFLKEEVGVKHLVSGPDHYFGRARRGNPALLIEEWERWEMGLTVIPPFKFRGRLVKSGLIRELLEEGRVEEAALYLGRKFFLEGEVTRGEGLGRRLGFPTANLKLPPEKLLPKDGVYAAECLELPAVIYIGKRLGKARTVEVHVVGLDAELYGERLRVYLHKYIREPKQFKSLEELREAVAQDVEEALRVLR